ncbi:MAG: YicC family protein [Planctomycetota bacterium]|nr:YicC family protein [Planctomycetota bacterium]
MTGYGAAQSAGKRVAVEVEVRSVNARALKLSLRTPSTLAPRETELDGLVRKTIRRGSITLFVRLQFLVASDLVRVRTDVVAGFAKALKQLRKEGLVSGELTPDGLANVPGALESGAEEPLRPADWKIVTTATQAALRALDEMRRREATHLVKELRAITTRMRKNLAHVRKRAPLVVKEHQKKLKERVDQLLEAQGVNLDPSTLAREVALLADRSDIAEELTRLAAHLDEFDGYLSGSGDVGRTLDFLCQELLRETNTIGSKSGDVAMAKHVIALKSDVDRLKEQVANLE